MTDFNRDTFEPSGEILMKLTDLDDDEIVYPIWATRIDPETDESGVLDDIDGTPLDDPHEMCESGDDTCEGDMFITGAEYDTWILMCRKHLYESSTEVTKDEYLDLVEKMLEDM
jgi:hypothetical protein